MKKIRYNFSVEVIIEESEGTFLESIKNELAQEQKELSLTKAINKKTTELHLELLKKFVLPINQELAEVGLEFGEFTTERTEATNEYKTSHCIIRFPKSNTAYVLVISGIWGEFRESRYTTYLGENYEYKLCKNYNSRVRAENIRFSRYSADFKPIKDLEDLFENLRNLVKKELTSTK